MDGSYDCKILCMAWYPKYKHAISFFGPKNFDTDLDWVVQSNSVQTFNNDF